MTEPPDYTGMELISAIQAVFGALHSVQFIPYIDNMPQLMSVHHWDTDDQEKPKVYMSICVDDFMADYFEQKRRAN